MRTLTLERILFEWDGIRCTPIAVARFLFGKSVSTFPRHALGAAVVACLTVAPAIAQDLTISGISVSAFGKANLCSTLGGSSQPPTITIKHSKGSGTITVSMADHLNDGRTNDHGSTSVAADPSGTTRVNYAFKPPCNTKTAEGLRSAYYVTASSGASSKMVLWRRYP
jgi:hypothetical protein